MELEFDDVDALELLKRKFPSPKKLKRDQMMQRPPAGSPQEKTPSPIQKKTPEPCSSQKKTPEEKLKQRPSLDTSKT